MADSEQRSTYFGFRQVTGSEKTRLVRDVFESVAQRYDLMNDLMSLGLHRVWRHLSLSLSGLRANFNVLDLAGGTGDMTFRMWRMMGGKLNITLSDINYEMLHKAKDKLIDKGCAGVNLVQCDASALAFNDNHFDFVCIAFGLRNVTHKEDALKEICRVLKPGGQLMILEFSHPNNRFLDKLYQRYTFTVLPLLGDIVVGDKDSYRYLSESIRMHPDSDTVLQMLVEAGFEHGYARAMTGNIVALHTAIKPVIKVTS